MTDRARNIHAALREKMSAANGRRSSARPGNRGRPVSRFSSSPSVAGPVGGGPVDVKELMKQSIFGSSSASCDDHFEKDKPCPSAVYGTKDHYFILDSFEKLIGSRTDRGEMAFDFNIQHTTVNRSIGTADEIATVITLQCGEFTIPVPPNDDFVPASMVVAEPTLSELGLTINGTLPTDTLVDNPQSQIPYRRITMFLEELGRQSFSDRDQKHHQFEFSVSLNGRTVAGEAGDRLYMTPLKYFELFILSKPLSYIHGLRLRFFNPDQPIRFPPDVIYSGATAHSNAGSFLKFLVVDPTNLINLAISDRIFISGFNLVEHATDGASVLTTTPYQILNTYINRPEGHLIGSTGFSVTGPTATVKTTSVEFRLNPDIVVTNLTPTGIGANVDFVKTTPPTAPSTTEISLEGQFTIYIAKNRIRIPVRARGVVEGLTNYIAP
jgi:hypothetical protein